MKITKIETLQIDLSGQNGMQSWRPVLARVHTDEGITGLGKVSLAYGIGGPAVAPMVRALGERFALGKDSNDTKTIWDHMLRRSFWGKAVGRSCSAR